MNNTPQQGLQLRQYRTHNDPIGELTDIEHIDELINTPLRTAKSVTPLIHCSDSAGKTLSVVAEHNNFNLLQIDIDYGNPSLEDIKNRCFELGIHNFRIYSTSSSNRNGFGNRWRILLKPNHSMYCDEWQLLQRVFVIAFGGDKSASVLSQGFYAPTNPDNGFYQYCIEDGASLDIDNLPERLQAIVEQIKAEEHVKAEQAVQAKPKPRTVDANSTDIFTMFNANNSIEQLLQKYGHKRIGEKYLDPNSTSGIPGGHVKDERLFTHHGCSIFNDGFSHDASDIEIHYAFHGDVASFIKYQAPLLDPEGQKARRLEHVKAQGTLTPAPSPESAPQGKPESLFESASNFLSETVKVEYLIRNLIEINSLVSITGPSGQYKSFVAVHLGCCFVSGRSWNGRTVKQGAVLYLAGEGRGGIKRRVKAYCIANSLALSDMRGFYLSKSTLMMDGSNIEQIVAEMAGIEIVAVFIDTTARHISGNENDSRDMGAYINAVDALRTRLNAVGIMVHHTGHDTTRGRGSTVYRAALDTEIMCDKSQLIFSKTKDAEPPEPMDFKLLPVEIGRDEEDEPITSCVVVYGEKSERNREVKLSALCRMAVKTLIDESIKEERLVINEMYGANTQSWRESFYKVRQNEGEIKVDTLKKSFQSVCKEMREKGIFDQYNKFADSVLIGREHQSTIHGAISSASIRNGLFN